MKLTTLDEDLRIHQKLEDEPNDVGGLSAQELKEKFDQAGVTIQKYLNETHLPEEEQAVEDALSEAKTYTDTKVRTLEQGNMKAAVYDTKKRRRDIFDYTDEKLAELQAKKLSGTWVCGGACHIYATIGATTKLTQFTNLVDPDGLWSETEKAFVMPEGGTVALVTVRGYSCHHGESRGYLRIKVNGEERELRAMGYYSSGVYEMETFVIPIMVEAGDRVSVEAWSYAGSSGNMTAQTILKEIVMVIFA